ncbi:mandelate racemase/muconate lactonizing enzyme family protein [Candidatus Latescibacterota bacterium]
MRRRSFFSSAAALGAIPLVTPEVEAQTKGINMKITAIELWRVTGDAKQYDEYLEEEYPKTGFIKRAPSPDRPLTAPSRVYMRITTDAGVEGFHGPHDNRTINEITGTHYSLNNVIGQDPLAIDTVWESMVTGDNRYTGMYMFRVAAINNALWDLKGRFCGLPVYRLLGGSRKVLYCYATCIGMPMNTLDEIAEGAMRVKKAGFRGQKWFPRLYGPQDGGAGLEFNINIMRTLREVLGNSDDIMIDPLTRWDLSYCMAWCKGVEQYRPRYLEEPVQTYLQTEPLARLRQMTSIPISTGEHNYNRWDMHELFKAGAVDIVNPDPEWLGVSEVSKICNMASAWGLQVSPHHMTHNPPIQVVASQPESVCPFFEYRAGASMGNTYFERYPFRYIGNSQVELSDRPGFGVELDESKIVSREMIFTTA